MRGASTWRAIALAVLLTPATSSANGGDMCTAPTAITALPFSDGGTTIGASHNSFTLPAGCATYQTVAGPDVIYSLTVGVGNSVTFQVVPDAGAGTAYDTSIYLFSDCDDRTTCVDGSDTGLAGVAEQLTVNNLPAGDYFFYVDSYYSTGSAGSPSRHQGAFTVNVTGDLGALPTTSTTTLPPSTTSTTVATTTTTSSTFLVTTTSTTLPSTTTTSTAPPSTTSTTAPNTTTTSTSTTLVPASTTSTTTSTSSTTTSTLLPLCSGGVAILGGTVKLTKLGDPAGNEGMLVRGILDFAFGTPATFDPGTRGAQLLVEDLGDAGILLDLTARTAPIPGGGQGTGCGPKDGWQKTTYHNTSNAVGAPECPADSAKGLKILKFKDKRAAGRGIAFKATVRGATLATPSGPLRVTLVLGADLAAGAAGECGIVTFADGFCALKRHTYTCR